LLRRLVERAGQIARSVRQFGRSSLHGNLLTRVRKPQEIGFPSRPAVAPLGTQSYIAEDACNALWGPSQCWPFPWAGAACMCRSFRAFSVCHNKKDPELWRK
jgi:hypothetical protein